MTIAPAAEWRIAALRGLSRADGREEALVALNVGQYLRTPIAAGRVDAFRARLGHRVWVELGTWSVELELPAVTCHD